MRIEELKKGQPYNVRLLFQEIDCDNDCVFIDPVDLSKIYLSRSNAANRVTPISTPSEPPTSAVTAPKYDHCRPFKKGDIVKPKENVYAESYAEEPLSIKDRYVVERVLPTGWLIAFAKNECETFEIWGGMLELVTPVEERVSYRVGDFPTNNEWCVWKDSLGKTEVVSSYKIDTHPNAKEAVQAECDRLNAEHRKEQENA